MKGMLSLRHFGREAPVHFNGLAFALFLSLCILVNWPGRLNEDSVQLLLGLHHPPDMTDLHSPVLALLWSLPAPFLKQPAAALLIQSTLLAFYAAMLPRPLPRDRRGLALLAFEILFKLSLVVTAGFIIKDILLVGLLLCALSALQRARSAPRPRLWILLAAALFFLAIFIRPTNFVMFGVAAALVLPLMARSWRGYGLALSATAALLLLTLPLYAALSRYAAGARPAHAEVQLFMFDVAGISTRTGRDLFAQLPEWPRGLRDPRQCYTPAEAAMIAPWANCAGYYQAGAAIHGGSRRTMTAWWLRSILRHPGAYAGHRFGYARYLLDPVAATRNHPVYRRFRGGGQRHLYALNRPDRLGQFHREVQGKMSPAAVLWWRDNRGATLFAMLSDWVWGYRWTPAMALLACMALIAIGWWRRWRGRPASQAAALAAAIGIGNFVMHALFGVASQGRYLYPTLLCAAFALIAALRHALAGDDRSRMTPATESDESARPAADGRTSPLVRLQGGE